MKKVILNMVIIIILMFMVNACRPKYASFEDQIKYEKYEQQKQIDKHNEAVRQSNLSIEVDFKENNGKYALLFALVGILVVFYTIKRIDSSPIKKQ